MRLCIMQRVSITDATQGLMCDQCGAITFYLDPRYCQNCGAAVSDIEDSDRDVYEQASRYAYDVGFDEGYGRAMEEVENARLPD